MADADRAMRLRRFWEVAIFSFGILWGISNIVYIPVAVLTTVHGSSWLEVWVDLAGGFLVLVCSIVAFYRRASASILLLIGGAIALTAAILGPKLITEAATGSGNILLLFMPGIAAILLGLFGIVTDRNHWPPLRGTR